MRKRPPAPAKDRGPVQRAIRRAFAASGTKALTSSAIYEYHTIPRGKYLGERVGDPPEDEAEHFIRCPACGGWIDCRDLGQVFEDEGQLPHPPQDQPQMTGTQFEAPRIVL